MLLGQACVPLLQICDRLAVTIAEGGNSSDFESSSGATIALRTCFTFERGGGMRDFSML